MDPSSSSQSNYDVFLSFRGQDTRHTIISHLYHALCQKGIRTFHDRKELKSGDRRDKLFEAIEGSHLAIIMFSRNYARSKWCLNELAKIMDQLKLDKIKAIPIFYRVSPGEVRLHEKDNGENGCYQIAMEAMEARYRDYPEMIERWREALWLGGDLIGYTVDTGQDENAVVRDTVKAVLKTLNRVPLEVATYPVRIRRHVKKIKKLLHIDPHADEVYMLGLHGQGGVGKTTLSKAICNDIAEKFDSWCFLRDIRRRASTVIDGLERLQLMLLRDLLSEEGLTVSSVDAGKNLIMERLRSKRVLVILDDVDEWSQFDALAGNLNWFGAGSRIIITTRNEHVLSPDRVQNVYRVNLLSEKKATNLFRHHAFGELQGRINIDQKLVDSFVRYAGGLPLALELLGRYLRGRGAREWEGKLKELANSPDRDINSVLKISFEGLDDRHKEMFLDVACFFKGWNAGDVEKILDSCGFAASLGMNILKERCLVKLVEGKIQMHDLLEEMGQSIIREVCSKAPSRIWRYNDFEEILYEEPGTKQAVEGIVLNLSEEKEVVDLESSTFKGLKNLRVLIFRNVAGHVDRLLLPRKMRWLEWRGCSASALEFDSSSKLVGLDVERSQIRDIKGRGFEELKYVNLSRCASLVSLPDLSKSTTLEDLFLRECQNLTVLDEAIGNLENLVHLDVSSCHELVTVPSLLRSKHLRTLKFRECSKLCRLPAVKEDLRFLENLDLTATAIKELPDSFGNLVALKELTLSGCKQLITIPSNIYNLGALKRLYLRDCRELSQFPRKALGEASGVLGFSKLISLHISNCSLKDLEFLDDLTCCDTLKELNLGGNEFTSVPECISKFNNLEFLWLNLNDRLVRITELPSVSMLYVSACPRLRNFPSFHTFVCQQVKWFGLDLSNCNKLVNGYIRRSLPLEKVRQFVGACNVICPGEEFPDWVNFQSTDSDSCYRVSLPANMSSNDVRGLALFIRFNRVAGSSVGVQIGHESMFAESKGEVGVHTWFVFIPVASVGEYSRAVNWHDLTLKFNGKRAGLKSWGMRLLCEQERRDLQVNVQYDLQI